MLLSKINAHMIDDCTEKITKEQIAELKPWKLNPHKFDHKKEGFSELVRPTYSDFDLKTHDSEADGYSVEFTEKENAVLS